MRASLLLPLALGCNDAPLWPDEGFAPDGEAPWGHPTDVGCRLFTEVDPTQVRIDGYLYCGAGIAFGDIVAVDDPIYSPCTSVIDGGVDRVMSVFDGVRARAYGLASMDHREIVHTEWDGDPLLVAYCPIIAGGDVWYRELAGDPSARFNVAGLWGSANTVTPRAEYLADEDYTVYTMWDGHALKRPAPVVSPTARSGSARRRSASTASQPAHTGWPSAPKGPRWSASRIARSSPARGRTASAQRTPAICSGAADPDRSTQRWQ